MLFIVTLVCSIKRIIHNSIPRFLLNLTRIIEWLDLTYNKGQNLRIFENISGSNSGLSSAVEREIQAKNPKMEAPLSEVPTRRKRYSKLYTN